MWVSGRAWAWAWPSVWAWVCFFDFLCHYYYYYFYFDFAGRHTKLTEKQPPPYTSDSNHLHNHANRARKSWRSDVSNILPGWGRHTGGSRSAPTVHPCGLRSGGAVGSSNHRHITSPNVKPYGRVKSRMAGEPQIRGRNPRHAAVTRQSDDTDLGQEDSQGR